MNRKVYIPIKPRLFVALLLGGTICCNGFAQAGGLDKAQAMRKALAITGLADTKGIQISAIQEKLKEADEPPSLRLAGQAVWRVSLKNVKIVVRNPERPGKFGKPWHREDGGTVCEHQTIHSLDILIDKPTGNLIKIRSPYVSGYPSRLSEAENLKASSERYVGVPKVAPKVNLLEALQATYEGLGHTLEAKQIEAAYVLFQTEVPSPCHDTPCPVWAIVLKGVPPMGTVPAGPDGKPAGRLPPYLNMRHLVSAVNGDWMGASNIP